MTTPFRSWLTTVRDIAHGLRQSLPHWRAWRSDYSYLAKARLASLPKHLRAALSTSPHPPTGRIDLRHVVVLPGIYETEADLSPLSDALRAAGHRIHHIPGLFRMVPPPAIIARRVEAYLRRTGLRNVVILAHSKGGLLGKYLLTTRCAHRIAGMVTIATPWHGSAYAALFWPGLGLRSLRPSSEVIRSARSHSDVNGQIVSICPSFDPHVPAGSHLPGADNRDVKVAGHFKVLADREVITLVVELISTWPRQVRTLRGT